ncbi:hypothetical protein M3194_27445 [Paenibacillus glycanilyticus]|uniref:hypothetical protein n=1 Tax=Paenibacillus glycanilyticus TaxID=126569 RepID=UPI00203DB24A|nr:hypothetical protein [Paenibacillus glycanilyticus]MCM3631055.1 hypothetical protein [Paenibacillus glycanilyticus]
MMTILEEVSLKIVSKMDLPISSDLIITDIMMPFLDGLKLLKQIREWELLPNHYH